jgi:hypothetical protein
MSKKKFYILKLESYFGEYSSLHCESEGNDFMYCICLVNDNKAIMIDYGYKSLEQAQSIWPEAIG